MRRQRIIHYMPNSGLPGGMAGYLWRVVAAPRAAGNVVEVVDDGPHPAEASRRVSPGGVWNEAVRLKQTLSTCIRAVATDQQPSRPAVRTMHGHWPYCPSGSRFLQQWSKPCPRAYSVLGCAWGHLIDHCGSRRPAEILSNFARTRSERRQFERVPVIAISRFVKEQMVRSGCCADAIEVLHLPAPFIETTNPVNTDGTPRFCFSGDLYRKRARRFCLKRSPRLVWTPRWTLPGMGRCSRACSSVLRCWESRTE